MKYGLCFCLFTSFVTLTFVSVQAQTHKTNNPFNLPNYQWTTASVETPFGIYGDYELQLKHSDHTVRDTPVYGSGIIYTDSWVYSAKMDLDVYYDVYDIGFHIKDYGTMLSIMNRFSPSRDHYFGFLVEGGKARFDGRPIFGAGLNANEGGRYTSVLFKMIAGGGKGVGYLDLSLGLGLRIPFGTNGITVGGKVYFEGMSANKRVWNGTPVGPTPNINGDYLFGFNPFVIVALGR
ncbi:MAG TPA: hypothetical protein VJ991_13600 [Balneolales bacterium]|nr:hypothetical protein [Balneolales bacterium]